MGRSTGTVRAPNGGTPKSAASHLPHGEYSSGSSGAKAGALDSAPLRTRVGIRRQGSGARPRLPGTRALPPNQNATVERTPISLFPFEQTVARGWAGAWQTSERGAQRRRAVLWARRRCPRAPPTRQLVCRGGGLPYQGPSRPSKPRPVPRRKRKERRSPSRLVKPVRRVMNAREVSSAALCTPDDPLEHSHTTDWRRRRNKKERAKSTARCSR